MAKKHKLVFLDWYDATLVSALQWERVNELESDGCHLHSAGILVKEDETGYFIAGDVDPADRGRVRCVSFIPKAMVRRIRTFYVDA